MELPDYPIYCHWGGEILQSSGDVTYKGGERKFGFVNCQMSYDEVLSKVYDLMRCDSRYVELKLLMRYPMMSGSYEAIPLDDDNSLKAMLIAMSQTQSTTMQLFIEQLPKQPETQSHLESFHEMDSWASPFPYLPLTNQSGLTGSFTRMLTDEQYASEHISELTSPTQTPHVEATNGDPSMILFDSLDQICVDFFGDEAVGVDSDVDEDEDTQDANDKAIRESAPSQIFNNVAELDPILLDSWRTWSNNHSFDGEFAIGQEFDSLAQLKDIVKGYSIAKNHSFKVLESEPTKYVVECKRKSSCKCSWRLRAIKDPCLASFRIVRYNGPHASNCLGDINSIDHPLLSSDFVCNEIKDLIRADPSLKIRVIVQAVKVKFKYTITYKRAWSAKQKAIASIFGDWEQSYEELPRYMQALKESNPGTVVEWCTLASNEDPSVHIFLRVFWAFKPSIDGFKHCRPLITIDGTHLYGKYKGTLLIAMGTDANSQLFPLAFAIVESENGESWKWFMKCIRHLVTQREGLCVISDRHAGILQTMNEVNSGWEEPRAHHRFCTRHLASNVNTQFKNAYVKNLFGKAADARQRKKFDYYLGRIGELNVEAHKYLMDISSHRWSIHHDGGFRYGVKTTNMSEAFNGVMKGARCLPITALVRMTFYRVNSYFVTRRGWGKRRIEEGHDFVEKATTTIEMNMAKSGAHEVQAFDHEMGLFEVTTGRGGRASGKGGNVHTVNLVAKTCTCEKLKIYKLPCSHVLAVCRSRSLSYAAFVDPFFTTVEYRQTYLKSFHPLPDVPYWPHYTGVRIVADASKRRGVGRPKSSRYPNEMDSSARRSVNVKSCSICRRQGHNKKTCAARGGVGSSG